MANFKVIQKTKTVKAFRKSMTEEDFEILEKYKAMDYKVIMLEKTAPRKKLKATKEDLIKYLQNGVIDKNLYAEMKKKLDRKENFLKIKCWLRAELDKKGIDLEALVEDRKKEENVETTKEEKPQAEASKK